MKILSITAGTAGMYCGSCSRDNALAVELLSRGHEVTLLPLYTPTTTDEANVSARRVFFSGIGIYLQQHLPIFRRAPRFLDRLWDSPGLIRSVASRSIATDPRVLGDLTVSMLEGDAGVLRKEYEKLLDWLADGPVPDVINLPNSLLIGLARPLREALKRPVCCTLQGEDLFLDGLVEPYRSRALDLIRRQVSDVDCFLAVSAFYVPVMSRLLEIPLDRVVVVPLGINLSGYERRPSGSMGTRARTSRPELSSTDANVSASFQEPFRIGYFARLAPEKGLHVLADAYRRFRDRTRGARARLDAAGYLSRAHTSYLEQVRRRLGDLAGELTYRGAVDRDGKLAFLSSLDVLSVPATYDEPKGVFLLEAMACGVPVVQPRRGAFTEVVEKTGGGLLVAPDDPEALADGLYALWQDRALADRLGESGFHAVRQHYSIARAADRLLDVYKGLAPGGSRDRERPASVAAR